MKQEYNNIPTIEATPAYEWKIETERPVRVDEGPIREGGGIIDVILKILLAFLK